MVAFESVRPLLFCLLATVPTAGYQKAERAQGGPSSCPSGPSQPLPKSKGRGPRGRPSQVRLSCRGLVGTRGLVDSGLVRSMSSAVSSVWVVALRLDCPCRHPRPDSGGPGGSVQFRTFVGCGGDDIVGLRDSTLRQLSAFNALHNRIAPEGINAS